MRRVPGAAATPPPVAAVLRDAVPVAGVLAAAALRVSAVRRAANPQCAGPSALVAAAVKPRGRLFGCGIGKANDDPRLVQHANVLRCYDLAITLAEADAGRVA